MGRRIRHLNAKAAGAVMHIDSRFIQGIANNTPLATWIDRTGTANQTQGTLAAQPTYSSSVQGGCPAVYFTKPNNFMSCADTAYPIGQLTYIGVHKCNTVPAAGFSFLFEYGTRSSGQLVSIYYYESTGGQYHGFTQFGSGATVVGQTNKWIISVIKRPDPSGGASTVDTRVYPDNLISTVIMTTNTIKSGTAYLGQGVGDTTNRMDGFVGVCMLFPTNMTDSLWKRFAKNMGFSFKIQVA